MPRLARVDVGGELYHVINRANGRLQIFDTKSDYLLFEELLREAKALTDMRILAYVVMSNHWHLILHPKNDGDLGLFMHRLTNAHTRVCKTFCVNTPSTHPTAMPLTLTFAFILAFAGAPLTGYANPHALTSVSGQTYTYDNAGNVTADGTRTNTWDYQNRLTQTLKSGTTYRSTYDHAGQRTAHYDGTATTTFPNKYYEQRGGVVTKHLYRPDGTLIATVTGTGTNATLRYLHTGNRDN